jgi:hypothetical protein
MLYPGAEPHRADNGPSTAGPLVLAFVLLLLVVLEVCGVLPGPDYDVKQSTDTRPPATAVVRGGS